MTVPAPVLSLADWLARRSYGPSPVDAETLAASRTATVSVVVPTRETADTIASVVRVLQRLRRVGLVDEVLVVDADTVGFGERFVSDLLAPMLLDPTLQMVKGTFARPFRVGDAVVPHGGGRVTELTARPLLNLHRPQLAGFAQPLAGEVAIRRGLLETLPFPVGYGVEIANLIDAADRVGVDALGQADLGERQNRHQDLRALTAMAYAVLIATARRVLGPETVADLAPGPLALPFGELELRDVPVEERPALRDR